MAINSLATAPWDGLGAEAKTLDQWQSDAGLGWKVERTPALYKDLQGNVKKTGQDVLYRDDTGDALSVVSERYRPVQPEEIFEFYRGLTENYGFEMETAGCMDGGKRIWCLANAGGEFALKGQDVVKNYLLLATSYDRSMATRIQFTSLRVVCLNMLPYLNGAGESFISVSHSATFDPDKIKVDLGITSQEGFETFEEQSIELSKRKVTQPEAMRFLTDVLEGKDVKHEDLSTRKANIIKEVYTNFAGKGMGSNLKSSEGTAWGLLNSVTQQVDHHTGRNVNNRMRSAWFGVGNTMKRNAFQEALKLVA